MKTDRILFGVACLALGYVGHTSLNKDFQKDLPEYVCADAPKMKPQIVSDTLELTQRLPKDTISFVQDSIKAGKRMVR
jgi:hypothetical protein